MATIGGPILKHHINLHILHECLNDAKSDIGARVLLPIRLEIHAVPLAAACDLDGVPGSRHQPWQEWGEGPPAEGSKSDCPPYQFQ